MFRRKRHDLQEFGKCVFVESDHDVRAFAQDGATQQVWFGNDEFDQFASRRKLVGKAAFFVHGVARVQKRRNRIGAENGFDLFYGQRLFGVIAFDELGGIRHQVAQETPGVAASGSSAFVKEVHLILDFEFWVLDS